MRGENTAARATRAYTRVLRVLPEHLRQLHGSEMVSDFRRLAREAVERRRSVWVLWVRCAGDVVLRSAAERYRDSMDGSVAHERGRRDFREGFMDAIQTYRRALRALMRRPGFTAIAVLTLGLGVGANVAIFTVVNGVLFRPLPYPESDRIVVVRHHAPAINLEDMQSSPGMIELYRESARTLTRMAAVGMAQQNLAGTGQPERVDVVRVTPEFFEVMRVTPADGRVFREEDEAPGAPPVAILTHAGWRTRFGGDEQVIGRTVQFEGQTREIIGVMRPDFVFPDPDAVALLPMQMDPARPFGTFGLMSLARIAPGETLESVRAELNALRARIPERFPDVTQAFLDNSGFNASVEPLRTRLVEDVERALLLLLGSVGLVLLVAGANVANLFLVRAESRRREMAIRSALGASRAHVAGVFLAESMILGVSGGAVGLLLATIGVRALVLGGPIELPRLHEVGVDGTVLLFALALSVTAGLLLGVLPLPRLKSTGALLRDGGRGSTVGRSRHRTRKLLIVAQVAVALMLMIGSGLALRSVLRLRAVDPGFRAQDVLTVGVSLGENVDRQRAIAFYTRVLDELRALPGVQSVGAANALPVERSGLNGSSFEIESEPREEGELPPVSMYSAVMPGFLETLEIPILAGRAPVRHDAEGGPPVAWVTKTFADRFLGGDAIGQRVRFATDTVFAEIVGVVGDTRTFGLQEEIRPITYLPMNTTVFGVQLGIMRFVLRTNGDPHALVPAVRAVVARADGTVPLTNARTMEEVLARSIAQTSFTVTLLLIAAASALVLGVVGLYGVISYVVSGRAQEIGVRIALGARPAQVRAMVVRQGLVLTLAGVVLGVAAAAASARWASSMLFEVSAYDPVTFVVTAIVITAVSAFAAYLPARRAAAVDPVKALRQE